MELHLYLYGEIAPDAGDPRAWGGPQIFGTNWLVSNLNSRPDAEEIVVHINSPGGDVVEGFAMHDILVASGKKVTTVVEGRAASIATIVTLAGSVRKITKNSTFLIHNPWQDGWIGDADHFRKVADGLETVEQVIANFYNEKTAQPVDQLLAYMKEEKEFTATEAHGLGFFTEVIETVTAKAYVTNINDMSKPSLMDRLSAAMKALKGGAVQNADFATADGQTLQVETAGTEPAAGDSVSVNGQPAADGEYKLADGKTVVVAAGKITEVKPAEAPVPPAPENSNPPAPAQNAEQSQVLNTLTESVTALAGTVQNLQQTVQGIQNNQTETAQALEAVTGSLELIGTTMQSEGFKKILNRNKFNEDGNDRTTKTPEAQKQNAIQAVRERAKLNKQGGKLKIKKDGDEE